MTKKLDVNIKNGLELGFAMFFGVLIANLCCFIGLLIIILIIGGSL